MKLLLVEDNQKLSGYIKEFLENNNFIAELVFNGLKAEYKIKNQNYDLIILDIMLPEKNGIEIVKSMRSNNNFTPVIMLTSLGELEDKEKAFEGGADDYLVKPFEMKELMLRIKALLKRPVEKEFNEVKIKNLKINISQQKVFVKKEEILLTAKEYIVLEYLMLNRGQILSRDKILSACWDFAYDGFSNIVDVYIKRLRNKIEKDEKYIKTIRGMGYRIEE